MTPAHLPQSPHCSLCPFCILCSQKVAWEARGHNGDGSIEVLRQPFRGLTIMQGALEERTSPTSLSLHPPGGHDPFGCFSPGVGEPPGQGQCFRKELRAQPGRACLWHHRPALQRWSVCEALAPSLSSLRGDDPNQHHSKQTCWVALGRSLSVLVSVGSPALGGVALPAGA